MTFDIEGLNPTEQRDRFTLFVIAPVCLVCGYGSFSRRRTGRFHCDKCQRIVRAVEFAPHVVNLPPQEAPFRTSSFIKVTGEHDAPPSATPADEHATPA